MADTYVLDPRDGYVLVAQRGTLSMEDAHGMAAAMEAVFDAGGHRCVVFDNRESEPPPPDVLAWVKENLGPDTLDRIGFVFNSEMMVTTLRLEGLAHGRRQSAFQSLEDAVAWMERGR